MYVCDPVTSRSTVNAYSVSIYPAQSSPPLALCRDEPTQLAALNLCQGMLPRLGQDQLAELLPLLREFGRHSSQQCRVVMYDILVWAYNNTWWVVASEPFRLLNIMYSRNVFAGENLRDCETEGYTIFALPARTKHADSRIFSNSHAQKVSGYTVYVCVCYLVDLLRQAFLCSSNPFSWILNDGCGVCLCVGSGSADVDVSLKRFASEVREQLLLGLADEAEDIRCSGDTRVLCMCLCASMCVCVCVVCCVLCCVLCVCMCVYIPLRE